MIRDLIGDLFRMYGGALDIFRPAGAERKRRAFVVGCYPDGCLTGIAHKIVFNLRQSKNITIFSFAKFFSLYPLKIIIQTKL